MKIHHNIDLSTGINNPVVTMGTFDGVHKGHKSVIHHLKETALQLGGESVIIIFHPHPRQVLGKDPDKLEFLNTLEEKTELIAGENPDHLILFPFTKKIASLSYLEFIKQYLVNQLKMNALIIGYDHQFGKEREGDFDRLQEASHSLGFKLGRVAVKDISDIAVSSTKIRKALHQGDIALVNNYLGYEYFMNGKVGQGLKIGYKIGFPTANIQLPDPKKLIPAAGVYAARIELDQQVYGGMLYIGNRPTLNVRGLSIEVNIFNFNQEIYGRHLKVSMVERLRGEKKFDGLEALREQLLKDKENSINVLKMP